MSVVRIQRLLRLGTTLQSGAGRSAAARPGMTLRYTAVIERLDPAGAATRGTVELIDPASGVAAPMGRIDLLFSHVDRNRAGLEFPEHNFVFTSQFMDLLRQSGFATP